jgi:hypothetical protein
MEQQIKDLKNRVCELMLLMVDAIHGKHVADISLDLVTDIGWLSECVFALGYFRLSDRPCNRHLSTVKAELEQIKQQNRWLLFFFANLNKSKVEDCVNSLQDALQRFQVCISLSVDCLLIVLNILRLSA